MFLDKKVSNFESMAYEVHCICLLSFVGVMHLL